MSSTTNVEVEKADRFGAARMSIYVGASIKQAREIKNLKDLQQNSEQDTIDEPEEENQPPPGSEPTPEDIRRKFN
jgi:hypothetical protein